MIRQYAGRTAIVASLILASIGMARATDDSLYLALGGRTGIERIANLAADQYLADPRINQLFGNTNLERFRHMLAEKFCAVTGGPCEYTGHSMQDAHKGLHLRNSDFNFVVEGLQKALNEAGIPFRTQNRLLAVLAPMQRDIVTR